jgi:tetratricopeptide (TPR) repeat protein
VTRRYPTLFRQGTAWLSFALGSLCGLASLAQSSDPAGSALPAANGAIEQPAPSVPASVIAALQSGEFAGARAALMSLREKAKTADERSYLGYLQGIAERLGGQPDFARETLNSALEANPSGRWAPKMRLELAAIELATGKLASAEALARSEATRLLAGTRKDQLAAVYQAFARRVFEPGDPLVRSDPNAAYELLVQALGLAESETLKGQLLLFMGQVSLAAANPARAIDNYQAYLKQHPRVPDRFRARFQLGEARRQAKQLVSARLTWSDLARDIERFKPADATPGTSALRAMALFELSSTYGIPNPPDDNSLSLGVAAASRFLAAFPEHAKAVSAAYSLGASYLARGKTAQALEAFTRFLKSEGFTVASDEARRDWARLSMAASFQVAQIFQSQGKYTEAIAAWKDYLAKFPNGSQTADAQRAILDTQLLIASEHRARKRFAEARSAWSEFVALNPLDARVPQAFFDIGESFATEKKYDQAITAWESLTSKFPNTEPAAHAQFAIAALHETEKGDLAQAIELFKKIALEPWKSQAAQRVAVMESNSLIVRTPRTFRSGEVAQLEITTRNIESLKLTAYKLSALAYFRKKHAIEGVESLDIGLVAADASWTASVPGYARYKPVASSYDLKPLELPGVYVVKVTDEKTLQATTLVIGSDVDAIVKTSREQILVLAQDMKTGKGRPAARVLVAQGDQIILDDKTGPDGVLLKNWSEPRDPSARISYLVMDGPHVAGSALGVPEKVAQGMTARAYIYTDRPAYRPGQTVAIRSVVREVRDGQYSHDPGSVYRLEVADARGRVIVSHPVALSEFGTFHESIPLDGAVPLGTYQVRVFQPGKSSFTGSFVVQSYELEPIDLAFSLKKTVYYRGETVAGDVIARYQYGSPVASRAIEVGLPDGRVLHGTTDAAGKFHLELATSDFAEEQLLRLVARLPQDNVAAAAIVVLAVRGFLIDLKTARDVYLDGESFPLEIVTTDAQGQPAGESLSVTVVKQIGTGGQVTERDVETKSVQTDAKSGRGTLTLRVDDADGGPYVLRVAGTDRFGNPIVADQAISISGKKDPTKLRLLADRQRYRVGEEAAVNLHSRERAGTALLAWEADRILSYKIVTLKAGDNAVAWRIGGKEFPNFTLTATRMWKSELDAANLDIEVERDLRVTIAPVKPVVAPGETIEVDVTTVDQLGRPVAAELSIAMVDQSLLRLYRDSLPEIGPFFYNQTRTGAFATESTNTFHYEPQTAPVVLALIEDAERLAAVQASAADRARVVQEAQEQAVAQNAPAAPIGGFEPGDDPKLRGGVMGAMGGRGSKAAEGRRARGQFGKDVEPRWRLDRFGIENEKLGEEVERLKREVARGAVDASVLQDAITRLGSDHARRSAFAATPLAADVAGGGQHDFYAAKKPARFEPRERFVETAYWNPQVVTDKTGKARIAFKAPAALSQYRLTARGITGSDTLAGQTTASLAVRKNFFVDLKVPAVLNQGDKPRFIGQIHHSGVRGKLELRLAIYTGGRDEVYPKTLELNQDGVDEVIFDAYEVPEGDRARLTLTAAAGAHTDELVVEVPVRPWGVEVVAAESGTGNGNATVFLGLPAGRNYESPEMEIVLAPTLRRMLIELALGRDAIALPRPAHAAPLFRILPPPMTTADTAADLLAAASALQYLRDAKASAAPEAERLSERIAGLVASFVGTQNPDGGWSWVVKGPLPSSNRPAPPAPSSDRRTSAAVVWALASAEPLGLVTDAKIVDHAIGYLQQEFAKLHPSDHETRAALLHALSTRRSANFEAANALNRARTTLSDSSLAYLALTFTNLDRGSLAREVLGILSLRAKSEAAAPGHPARVYWDSSGRSAMIPSAVETTALATLAFARALPSARELQGAVEWLLAHRAAESWRPHKAKGAALAALSSYYGHASQSDDRYRLLVSVNGTQVAELSVTGETQGRAIGVPRKVLKVGQPNRIHFEMQGRGRFGFAATLSAFTREFGPDQDRKNRVATVDRRYYQPAAPELDGKVLPAGFSVTPDQATFENVASQVELGGKARVVLSVARHIPQNTPEWERPFLIVEDHLPAGATLIEGSVNTQASSYTLANGVLTFYFAPDRYPGMTTYEIYGHVPGQYRALPASVGSAYEPGRYHLGTPSDLRVRLSGEPNTDSYRPTPDELFARGKAHYDAGRYREAGAALEPLFSGYTLRDDVARSAAAMLLLINIQEDQARKIVQYFEVVKEKAPELILTFDQLVAIGKAYRDINEYERATIVWRGLIEASYLEDARIGELLRQRGETLRGLAYLIKLWQSYPNTASIESDFFGLSQVVAAAAGRALSDANLRREMAAAGITRSELLLQTIRMIQAFLSQSPKNPLADEASLALLGAFTDLEDYPAAVKLAASFAKLYPRSTYLDSFQFSEALADFHLGQYDRAIAVAEAISRATYKDAAGVDQPSPNKWQSLFILGQIHDARRRPAKALEYYRQVADRFTDATSAVEFYTRKELKIPEVVVVHSEPKPVAEGRPRDDDRRGVRVINVTAGAQGTPKREARAEITLGYRNIGQVDVKIYPVDLMQLYLTRRNLNGIAGIDLAGITPLVETAIPLGDGADFEDKSRAIPVPLANEGAFLTMIRGENLYASGIVLITPLGMEVLEEPAAGRVRVSIRDTHTKDFLPKVQVKVIGSDNGQFISGETDLRGVFVAEGVRGLVTAVARQGSSQFAFYRGTTYVGQPAQPPSPMQSQQQGQQAPAQLSAGAAAKEQALDANLREQNMSNSFRQIERLEKRLSVPKNQPPGAAAGEFR